eukprot:gene32985-biopygen17032
MKVIDGALNSKACCTAAPITVAFPVGVLADEFRFGTGNDRSGRDPIRWVLDGSVDESTWVVHLPTAAPVTPDPCTVLEWEMIDQSAYALCSTPMTRSAARRRCAAGGGWLASIPDQTANDKIRAWITSQGVTNSVWIGLNDIAAEAGTDGSSNRWVWDGSGAAAGWRGWSIRNPGGASVGDCVVMSKVQFNGGWNDIPCDGTRRFLCEKRFHPSAAPSASPTCSPTAPSVAPSGAPTQLPTMGPITCATPVANAKCPINSKTPTPTRIFREWDMSVGQCRIRCAQTVGCKYFAHQHAVDPTMAWRRMCLGCSAWPAKESRYFTAYSLSCTSAPSAAPFALQSTPSNGQVVTRPPPPSLPPSMTWPSVECVASACMEHTISSPDDDCCGQGLDSFLYLPQYRGLRGQHVLHAHYGAPD